MIVKYRSVLSYTFILIFFLAVDLCKIFIKNKLNYYWVPFFGTLSHILEVPSTLFYVLLVTSYLHHPIILSDGRILLFSVIIKFLINK